MAWCEVYQVCCELAKECENEEQCIFRDKFNHTGIGKQVIVTCNNEDCMYRDGDICGLTSIRIDSKGHCTGKCDFE